VTARSGGAAAEQAADQKRKDSQIQHFVSIDRRGDAWPLE